MTSDNLRLDNCENFKVYNNVLYSYDGNNNNGYYKHGENGLQIGDQGFSKGSGSDKPTHSQNGEVYGNTFANNGLQAIVLDAAGKTPSDNIYIHDNDFVDVAPVTRHGEPISYTNPPTKETSHKVFETIFDFLEMDFSDTANTTNTQVNPDINWEESGESRAWVDIVGWDNMVERDGVFFIPAGQQPIIRYEAENTASRPVSTDTYLTFTEDNGTLAADLEVTAVYEVARKTTKKVNGISVPSVTWVRKSSTSHYYDSEPIPGTYSPSINSTAYVTIINGSMSSQAQVYVPESLDVMKVLFEYNSSQTWHYLHTCTINETEKGVQYAQISDLDYWEGENVTRIGNTLVIPGALDPEDVESIQDNSI